MIRVAVTSSNIASIGFELNADYDPKNARGTLEVEFKPTKKGAVGDIWRYYDVPAALRLALTAAPSIGSFFHKAVRMGGFRCEKVGDVSSETEALYRSWDRESLLGMRGALQRDQAAQFPDQATQEAIDPDGDELAWFVHRLTMIDRIISERGW